jgi:uncharacterized membrane protein YedE/YeeE
MEVLNEQAPWWLVGPCFGLVVVGLLATINQRIGILGGYSDVVENVGRGRLSFGWKAWFLFGVIGGGLLYAVLADPEATIQGYGWVTRELDSSLAVAAVLVLGGALIGYGAKVAGGCTSGNGIGACSLCSPSGFVATGTFMATAIAGAFVIDRLVIG